MAKENPTTPKAQSKTIPPRTHRIIHDPFDLIQAGDLVWTPGINKWESAASCHYSVRVRNFHAVARKII